MSMSVQTCAFHRCTETLRISRTSAYTRSYSYHSLTRCRHAPASHTIISLTITFPFFRSPDPAHGVALITPGNNRSGSAMGWVGFPCLPSSPSELEIAGERHTIEIKSLEGASTKRRNFCPTRVIGEERPSLV